MAIPVYSDVIPRQAPLQRNRRLLYVICAAEAFERGSVRMSGFRVKFTLSGGIELLTSPPSDSLELAVNRAADLERGNRASVQAIVGPDGDLVLDRDGCARLLREKLDPL
jgi:hypothetical protein